MKMKPSKIFEDYEASYFKRQIDPKTVSRIRWGKDRDIKLK
jgi:hypothetical protein